MGLKQKRGLLYYLLIAVYGIAVIAAMKGVGSLYGSQVDWLGQHVVFPDMFRQTFYESGQLLPNLYFQIGGGQNAFQFTYYGLLSPVILISYLLPFVDMTTYVMCASVCLYLASGILVFQFLKGHFGDKKAFGAAIVFLSLSPVNYHFHHHIMFVWYLPFLMLGLIGLDKYFREKKRWMFVLAAFCLILTNYYFSVSGLVCLFVYAIYKLLQEQERQQGQAFKRFCHIVALFLLPVLLSAFILLPTAYALFSNGRGVEVTEGMEKLYIPELKNTFFDHYGMGISGIMLIAVIGNLVSKNVKKSEKFLYVVLLVLILCPVISYALNGMLYVRGKVLIPFAVLFAYALCSFVGRLEKQEICFNRTIPATLLFVLVTCLADGSNRSVGIFILAGLLAVLLLKRKPLLLYVCVTVVSLHFSYIDHKEEDFVTEAAYDKVKISETQKLLENAADAWYRTDIAWQEHNTANRVYGERFNGTSIYSSTFNGLYQDFYRSFMGNNESFRNCFITGGARNELFYTFMGTRYIVAPNDPGLYYEKVFAGDTLNLYENKAAYPIAYKSKRILREETFDTMSFPYSAEYLMSHTIVQSGGDSDYHSCLEKCEVESSYRFEQEEDTTYELELDEAYKGKLLYLSFDIVNEGEYRNKKDIIITINGVRNKLTSADWLYYNANTDFDYVISLEDDTTLSIEVSAGKYNIQNLKMYVSPMLKEEYEEPEKLRYDSFSSVLSCTVQAQGGEYLVTSIPYDKGFSAFVNGEPVETVVLNKAFVGVKLGEGENSVRLKYTSPWFVPGVCVSVFAVVLLFGGSIYVKRREKHDTRR